MGTRWPGVPAGANMLGQEKAVPTGPASALHSFNSFFSAESGFSTRLFYVSLFFVTILLSAVSVLAPLMTPECDIPFAYHHRNHSRSLVQGLEGGLEDAPNPSYVPDPCRWERYWQLFGMNKWEADMSRRLIMSIVLGSIIGFERRRADRPAGIRTMAMVCLGSCVFTLGSMYAFVDGTMGWDASRVSAAIPSGVGFLGAASIWKGTKGTGSNTVPEVHGLTTATSVWLSAAVGILAGGALYVPGLFTTFAGVVYLRFAPRLYDNEAELARSGANSDDSSEGNDEESGGIKCSTSQDLTRLMQPLNPDGQPNAGSSAPPIGRSPRSSKHEGQTGLPVTRKQESFRKAAEIYA